MVEHTTSQPRRQACRFYVVPQIYNASVALFETAGTALLQPGQSWRYLSLRPRLGIMMAWLARLSIAIMAMVATQ